jgi:predicted dehydrogenase
VNVPNDAHAAVARDALLAGRAVCVEKPLAVTVAEGRGLCDLAARQGAVLFTAFHRRYNAPVLRLRDEVLRRTAAGARVARVTVRYWERIEEHVGRDRWYLDAARCGGGCVADNGPNALDLVHLLVGDVTLTRAAVDRDAAGTDRRAVLELAAPDGTEAVVDLDWSYGHGEVKDVTVRFADGAVLGADMLDGHPEFKGSLAHEYVGVLDHLARVVRGTSDAWPDGLRALELVHDAYALGARKRAPHTETPVGNTA